MYDRASERGDADAVTSQRGHGFLHRLLRRPANAIALAYLALWAVLAVFGQRITGYDPVAFGDLEAILVGPTLEHPLGTDAGGKDTLAQLIVGARIDLGAAALATALGALVGVPLGLVIGFARSTVDTALMRLVEAIQSIPGIIVVTTIITIVGRGIVGATLAIAVISAVIVLVNTRAEVRRQRDELYVASARVLGVPQRAIAFHHVLPNVLPILVIVLAIGFGGTLLALSGVSLLGFGQAPPTPSWGTMLQLATQNMNRQWFAVVPPGLAIASVVFAVNVLADGVRGALGRSAPSPGASAQRSRRWSAPLSLDIPAAPAVAERTNHDSPASTTEHVLVVRELSITHEARDGTERRLVDSVSFEVRRGHVLGIVGESGSGKSLTVSAATGITPLGLRATAEAIEIAGSDLASITNANTRRRFVGTAVGMVFQNPQGSLNPAQRVAPQVVAALREHRGASASAAHRRVLELLAAVGIEHPDRVARSYPHQLSGGMAQRVMIAAALVGDPDLLIADECTTALDVTVQAQVVRLLRSIADERQIGVVFITHDLAVVTEIADEVLVMQHGRVVERGPIADVFHRPEHPYTRQLLEHVATAGRAHAEVAP
jgi:peptide/nickel transport system permease protein